MENALYSTNSTKKLLENFHTHLPIALHQFSDKVLDADVDFCQMFSTVLAC